MHREHDFDPLHLVREISARAAVAIGLAGIGLIHLLDSIGKYDETRYIFWMYMALIVGSLAVAAAVLFTRSRVPFLGATALAASAIVGYVLSRTTGLPHATDDVGNWTEPLGLASLFVEGAVVASSLTAYTLVPRAVIKKDRRLRSLVLADAA
jgi:xanthine/uracil permease